MEGENLSGDLVASCTFYTPPPVVGGYRLGKQNDGYCQINITYKPKWLHRQMMRIFFGWYWFDAE